MDLIRSLGYLALGSRLRRISDQIMKDGIRIYETRGISFEPRWFPVFYLLKDGQERTVSEIARELRFSHPAVVQIANSMQKHGMLESLTGMDDKRTRVISLSETGRKLLPQLMPVWEEIREAVEQAGKSASADLLATLDRIESALAEESLLSRAETVRKRKLDDDIRIIEFSPESALHARAFRELNEEWLRKYFVIESHDREMLENPVEYIIEPGGCIFLAELGTEIVGTCALIYSSPGVFELAKMAVTERAQGRQIGKRLAMVIIERAVSLGAKSIFLESNSKLTPALNLYRKLGFRFEDPPQSSEYARADVYMKLEL